jgi:hypothetical protein
MDETDPVADDEQVYRRIHIQYFRSDSAISVQRGAFHPTEADDTGISIYRASFVSPGELIPADKATLYYVARLPVRELRNLGLSVVAEPMPDGPPGHALIPELARASYVANKRQWAPILVQLAALASVDIVYRPTS